jgi:hypothetical protein
MRLICFAGGGGGCKPKYYEDAKEAYAYVKKFLKEGDIFLKHYKTTEHMYVNNIS